MFETLWDLMRTEGRTRFYCALTQGQVLVVSVNESLEPVCASSPLDRVKAFVNSGQILIDLRLLQATRYPPDPTVNYKQYVTLDLVPTIRPQVDISDKLSGHAAVTPRRAVAPVVQSRELRATERYDAFISYNSMDGKIVEHVSRLLEDQTELTLWKDSWELAGGDDWIDSLSEAIAHSRSIVVFVGPSGLGAWHREEIKIGINKAIRHGMTRVIPVALPGSPEDLALPDYLDAKQFVDMRSVDAWSIHLLRCAIVGDRPGRRDRFEQADRPGYTR